MSRTNNRKIISLFVVIAAVLIVTYLTLALVVKGKGELVEYRRVVSQDNKWTLTIYRQMTNKYDPIAPIDVFLTVKNENGKEVFKEHLYELDLWTDLRLPPLKFTFNCNNINMEALNNGDRDVLEIHCP